MWLIGIAPQDMIHAGSLLGQKIIMTEFIGYVDLANLKAAGAFAQTKSVIMCTYFLCGFANFASIGIQIGGIGGLTPKNKPLLAQFGMRALLAGTLASLLSATVVGMIIGLGSSALITPSNFEYECSDFSGTGSRSSPDNVR